MIKNKDELNTKFEELEVCEVRLKCKLKEIERKYVQQKRREIKKEIEAYVNEITPELWG